MEVRKNRHLNDSPYAAPKLIKIFLLGLLVLSLVFAANQINFSSYFPIKYVHVHGMIHTKQNELKTILTPMVKRGYFNFDKEEAKDKLTRLAWVQDALVKRKWPNQLEIILVEKNPIAIWNERYLLLDNGELFSTSDKLPQNIPHFLGLPGKELTMLAYYKDINRLLALLHVTISSFELTDYYTFKLTLTNGLHLQAGYQDVLTRMTHFVKVYSKIIGKRVDAVDYVDLRYPNGLAIRWKETPAALA